MKDERIMPEIKDLSSRTLRLCGLRSKMNHEGAKGISEVRGQSI